MLPRRALPLLLLPAAARGAEERFPDRTIRMISPFAAGGPSDVVGRPLAEGMGQALGVPVVLEYRPGGGGIPGMDAVAKARPDGYTLLLSSSAVTTNAALVPELPYNTLRDFAPLSQVSASLGMLLVARPGLAVRSLEDVLALARVEPGGLSYGHSGAGNITNLCGELMQHLTGTRLLGVVFRGTPAVVTEMMGERIDLAFVSLSAVNQHLRAGRLRPLAFTGPARPPGYPDVPTFAERGLAALDLVGWQALWATGGTPAARLAVLHQAVQHALALPRMAQLLAEATLSPVGSSPAEFTAFMARDLAAQHRLVRQLGLRAA